MNSKQLLIALSIFTSSLVFAQPCLNGGIVLSTQASVDSFPINYPSCNLINGVLEIAGTVNNLDSLYQLDSIASHLKLNNAKSLKSIWGLHNVKYLGGELNAIGNDSLKSLRGLNGISKISYVFISNNKALESFRGLDSVKEITSLYVLDNDALDSITGLGGLNSILNIFQLIGNSSLRSMVGLESVSIQILHIIDSDSLKNLVGLENNVTIARSISVSGNTSLVNLKGVENFPNIPGSLQISGNPLIKNLDEFSGLKYVGEGLYIAKNSSLKSISGLDSVWSVGSGIVIKDNDRLKNLKGLEKLDSVGGIVSISQNDSLWSLNGLNNLAYIKNSLVISQNKSLRNLTGLESLNWIGALNLDRNQKLNDLSALIGVKKIKLDITIRENDSLVSLHGLDSANTDAMTSLYIYDAQSLSVCAVQSICDYVNSGRIAWVLDNAAGCSDTNQIKTACASISIPESEQIGELNIFPNPALGDVTIELKDFTQYPNTLTLYQADGREIRHLELNSPQFILNTDDLKSGLYFLNISNRDGTSITQKLFVQ